MEVQIKKSDLYSRIEKSISKLQFVSESEAFCEKMDSYKVFIQNRFFF